MPDCTPIDCCPAAVQLRSIIPPAEPASDGASAQPGHTLTRRDSDGCFTSSQMPVLSSAGLAQGTPGQVPQILILCSWRYVLQVIFINPQLPPIVKLAAWPIKLSACRPLPLSSCSLRLFCCLVWLLFNKSMVVNCTFVHFICNNPNR